MDNAQQDATDVKESLKSRHGADCLGDVPRYEIFTNNIPLKVKTEWLDANYNVKEIAYFADVQLDFLEYQAGMADRPDGIKWDDPEEGSNVLSSEELGELAVRLDEVEDKVRRIKNSKDTYSHRAESRQEEVRRLEDELAEYRHAGRLHHLKRLILG